MKKDGRSQTHETLEQFRMLGLERIRSGESPRVVAESFGMHRSWGYRITKRAAGRGKGKRALKSTVCTGRPRKLTPSQEQEVFRCMDGRLSFTVTVRDAIQESDNPGLGDGSASLAAIRYTSLSAVLTNLCTT
jgi:transposase